MRDDENLFLLLEPVPLLEARPLVLIEMLSLMDSPIQLSSAIDSAIEDDII